VSWRRSRPKLQLRRNPSCSTMNGIASLLASFSVCFDWFQSMWAEGGVEITLKIHLGLYLFLPFLFVVVDAVALEDLHRMKDV
jgi:hypothetical protein